MQFTRCSCRTSICSDKPILNEQKVERIGVAGSVFAYEAFAQKKTIEIQVALLLYLVNGIVKS